MGRTDLELMRSVEIQLRHNHYPPVDSAWTDVAIQAIKTVEADPEGDRGWSDLEIPATHRKGSKTHISVSSIMDDLHLWDLVRSPKDDDENIVAEGS